ncbi:thioredoxin [Candidatus Liberibacter sp.]|uniref:thioredoxin n=1 Tax=Candidatus Liberibacter sp. TaxID=34022 RepID=UPI0015F72BBC|nr:thioredoxin [Candidatus Liberibacter sp.]MBA5723979.1 thioredoxin [Candidatus Liberibacter sp.]
MGALKVDSSDFDCEVLKSSKPVVVDFWAEWCQPCLEIAPILDKISEEFSETVKIVKVDIEKNLSLNKQYKVTSIPTLVFFKDGKVIDTMVGKAQKSDISKWISSLI